ncbi:hypothetical protein AJ78_02405 [Emergomyces pasteurianus Ep9510]|uniref:Uncharacterized protein n=1 Tax=Emergomyces pasteurianus Ep9510 TaxID=1447872 RepID=A0A1J9QNN8_9EURO|nr:hypothetical protein AJ78_02405 [Emergomyces pasteurianus Ep9510]
MEHGTWNMKKQSYYVDIRELDKLAGEVFIPTDLVIDFSKCFSTEAITTAAKGTATDWKKLMNTIDQTPHIPRYERMQMSRRR